MIPTARRLTLAMLLAITMVGCAETGPYLRDRAYDLVDVVDFKYGFGVQSLGFGAKIEVTEFLGLGAGYGISDHVREWRGRRSLAEPHEFAHVLVAGFDGPPTMTAYYILLFNTMYYVPLRDTWRVGGEVLLPLAHIGAYINAFEILDFVGGIVTWDPSMDDGLPFNSPLEVTR